MIGRHAFREDLYYRLNGLALRLPPLRERSDLEVLARRIVLAHRPGDPPGLSEPVLELFRRYSWPGNIRQLANLLRTAAVMSIGEDSITTAHLSDDFLEEARQAPPSTLQAIRPRHETPAAAGMAATSALLDVLQLAPEVAASAPAEAAPARTLDEAQTELIRSTLQALGGNISAASKQLGISRNTVYRKLRWNVGKTTD
jgi:transcriptional regulator of acetoin/glycerol metabolism